MLITVPAQPSELSGIRSGVRMFVERTGGDRGVAADLELVVSELATNVIEHTTAATISVLMERDATGWTIQVAHVDDASMLDNLSLPDATSLTGRGLFVVSSLVDTLEVIDTDNVRAVRCVRSAG
jgi:anti-sigma regulatory factor (Ser/Thr protein kinase)